MNEENPVIEHKKKNVWKRTAIIFIILFVLETAFFIYAIYIGGKQYNLEIDCNNICLESGADSYIYMDYENLCECYDNAGILLFRRILE